MVKLYALSTCPWCKKAKKLLDEQKKVYDFIEVDLAIGLEQQEAITEVKRLTGDTSFPVTVIGQTVIAGYKPEEIIKALQNEPK